MNKLLEVREFESITCNEDYKQDSHYKYLELGPFTELENLILTYKDGQDADTIDFLSLTSRRNVGKVICAKNYVGLIQMKHGYQIQILPKIDSCGVTDTKCTFLKMLRSMKDFPSKVFNEANLKTDQMNLYEVFINMYVQEVRNLVKKGIKSAYYSFEENVGFYKGKLVVNEHIKRNIVHKERFFVKYDDFSVNRAENRLIKSTLIKLIKISNSTENIKEMWQLLSSFEMIEPSINYVKDFSKVVLDRNTKDYENLIKWSKVFLMDKSFTTFSGNASSRALLFPMEKVFESYVGRNIKRALNDSDWDVSLQDKGRYLFESKFALKPDIVIKNENGRKIILDTKWKSLENSPRHNYGISQSDMYQIYAYAKKYQSSEVWLLFPINNEMKDADKISFKSDDEIPIKVSLYFIDVNDIDKSISGLIEIMGLDIKNENSVCS